MGRVVWCVFFSSRRRHTRCYRDWSSDVCSSDLSYGQRKPIHPLELGSVERYRFILSPLLAPIIDSGAALGSTGLESTGNSLIDVYPFIVVAEDAWGDVAVRGMRSFKINHLPHNQPDKSDPGGQRGYLHASFWSAMFMQNDGWAAVIEAGVTDMAV